MKASQVITELQRLILLHGDLEVCANDGLDPCELDEVKRIDLVRGWKWGSTSTPKDIFEIAS